MRVSLRRLLEAGEFGDLRAGMTIEAVKSRMGEPDDWGGTSRKYRHPSLYLFGTVELWFEQPRPRGLTGIYWEAGERGEFRLSDRCVVEDWELAPGMSFEQVEGYLNAIDCCFGYRDWPCGRWPPEVVIASGVVMSFDGEGRLHAVYAPAPGQCEGQAD